MVVPKKHSLNIFDISEEDLKHSIALAKRLAITYMKELNAEGVNILNASGNSAHQSVPHFHIHVIPRHVGDGIDLGFNGNPELREKSMTALAKIKGNIL